MRSPPAISRCEPSSPIGHDRIFGSCDSIARAAGATRSPTIRVSRVRDWSARLLLGGAVVVALIAGALFVAPRRPPPPKENVALERELDRQIGELTKSLPRKIDAATTLTAISRDKTIVVYHFRVVRAHEAKHAVSAEFYTPPAGFVRKVCADPDAFATMMAGATLRYDYADQNGSPFGEYDVDAHACAQFLKAGAAK